MNKTRAQFTDQFLEDYAANEAHQDEIDAMIRKVLEAGEPDAVGELAVALPHRVLRQSNPGLAIFFTKRSTGLVRFERVWGPGNRMFLS